MNCLIYQLKKKKKKTEHIYSEMLLLPMTAGCAAAVVHAK